MLVKALMSGWVELDLDPDPIDDPESDVFPNLTVRALEYLLVV